MEIEQITISILDGRCDDDVFNNNFEFWIIPEHIEESNRKRYSIVKRHSFINRTTMIKNGLSE